MNGECPSVVLNAGKMSYPSMILTWQMSAKQVLVLAGLSEALGGCLVWLIMNLPCGLVGNRHRA